MMCYACTDMDRLAAVGVVFVDSGGVIVTH